MASNIAPSHMHAAIYPVPCGIDCNATADTLQQPIPASSLASFSKVTVGVCVSVLFAYSLARLPTTYPVASHRTTHPSKQTKHHTSDLHPPVLSRHCPRPRLSECLAIRRSRAPGSRSPTPIRSTPSNPIHTQGRRHLPTPPSKTTQGSPDFPSSLRGFSRIPTLESVVRQLHDSHPAPHCITRLGDRGAISGVAAPHASDSSHLTRSRPPPKSNPKPHR
ncbi:hypothetical protein BV22DRAFT_1036198 [Leucogyrophana mollusca]|uniref:Uncharacterized protein n=1 Tax=Leucogyrophana mollusca TaxID=85980 RepID=A0ACB8BEA0_9AGAM|nr:hypothetical protein BV22DRAFT_1036198 [Leucogyrophana mollusca]